MRGKIIAAVGVGVMAIAFASLFLWWSGEDAPTVSAQAIVDRACAGTADLDSYDMLTIMKMEQDGVALEGEQVLKISIEDKDFEWQVVDTSDGAMNEAIRVGGVGYERFAEDEPWRTSKTSFSDVTTPLDHLGTTPVCPDLGKDVKLVGEETLHGEKVTVYTAEDYDGVTKADLEKLDSSFEGVKHAKSHKYWVNGQGHLVQYWEDRYSFSQGPDGDYTMLRFTFTTNFFEIGQPNTITAPSVQ